MSELKSVSFNQFYINEFFEKVKELSHHQFSGDNHELINDLFNHLKSFDDIVNGLEDIAQEQSANELSLFLFDIIDRIGDYPPTLVYESLPEIVEDFLNALGLMFEEDEFITAMKNLNKKFSEQEIREPETQLPEEVPMTEPVIEEIKEDVEKVEKIKEEIETEPKATDSKPEEVVPEEETLNFEQFIELEFSDELSRKLNEKVGGKKSKKYISFLNILLENINLKKIENVPKIVNDLALNLKTIYPWKAKKSFSPSIISNELSKLIDLAISNLQTLDDEYPKIIKQSIKKNEIIIPEIKEKKKVIKEEIPEKPTTIDSLLSEYFQSEVNEYVQQLRGIIKKIKKSPNDPELHDNMVTHFQSFKEVSMIHGYILVEDFCNGMINLFSQKGKKKKSFNIDSIIIFDRLFDLLKETENLKEAKKRTPESMQLQELLNEFNKSLFSKPGKLKKDEAEEELATATEEPEQEQISKIEDEPSLEEDIKFKDEDALLSVLSDTVRDFRPSLEGLFTDKTQIENTTNILVKLESASNLVGQASLKNVIVAFKDTLLKITEIKEDNQLSALESLWALYDSFQASLSNKTNFGEWQNKLAEFDKNVIEKGKEFGIDDTRQILKIIVEIEKNNLVNFPESIKKIQKDKDATEREKQFKHFNRLKNNMLLIGEENLIGFPEFFIKIFDPTAKIKLGKNVIEEIEKSYKLLIDSLESKKVGSDMEEIISLLKEMVFEKETSAEVVKEAPVPTEESDEDLEVIFRQEAQNYLEKIDEALSVLNQDASKKDQYTLIEKAVHSVKSSARLMGYHDIANISAPLESVCEQIQTDAVTADSDTLNIVVETIEGIKKAVEGEQIDYDSLKQRLDGLVVEKDEKKEESPEVSKEESLLDDKPLFSASTDEDEELLEIFKEESAEFIKTIEKASGVLKDDPLNSEALSQLEYASHSLKTAAKMLGFREIGEIADKIEIIAEAIHKGELNNDQSVNKLVTQSIKIIKDLSTGNKIESEEIAAIIEQLEINKIKKEQGSDPAKPSVDAVFELESSTQLFLKEGWELIDNINRDLVKFEKSPKNSEILNDLNRHVHTLKSAAQMLHFEKIGNIAHKIEDCFDYFKTSEKEFSGENIDVLFNGIDEIQNLMESIKSGRGELSDKYDSVMSNIDIKLLKLKPDEKSFEEDSSELEPKLIDIEKSPVSKQDDEQVIKITTDRLDKLVNMASELVVKKTQLDDYLEKLRGIGKSIEKNKKKFKTTNITIEDFIEKQKVEKSKAKKEKSKEKSPEGIGELEKVSNDFKEIVSTIDTLSTNFNSITQDFEQNFSRISSLTKILHEDILQVRMVPTEQLFNRFPRAVRDLAKKQKKKINLAIEGENTEMDRAMIESINDPVMHLIRNAIDHGIELPKKRTKKGKSEEGIILLKARQNKNQVIVEVQDDGQGIDVEKIKDTIFQKKLAKKKEIEKMSETEIFDFLFHPGFSTKKVVSDVSGRGVGLDVVAERIKKLKGDIRINSTIGKGTTFSIRVPLTLAISQAMLVKVHNEVLAIPIMSVEETVNLEETDIIKKGTKDYLSIRGESIPFYYLSNLLDYGEEKKPGDKKQESAIIIQESDVKYGLIVDEVLRREEILIKSLGEKLTNVEYISGGTIFGDGSIALIVDTIALARKVESEGEVESTEQDFSSIERAKQLSDVKETEEEIDEPQIVEDTTQEKAVPDEEKSDSGMIEKTQDGTNSALIVDDSISIRKFVSSILEKHNFSTLLAKDGHEALDILKSNSFDIIITDLEMPKMQGFELIEEIRKQKKFDDTPIVILTGRASKKHKEEGMSLGANAYIVKPFKDNDLLNTVKKFVKVK